MRRNITNVENLIKKVNLSQIDAYPTDVLKYISVNNSNFVEYAANGAMINAGAVERAFKHINEVELNNAGNVKYTDLGISGAHNHNVFMSQVYNPATGKGRIVIQSNNPTSVAGYRKIEYKVLAEDGKGGVIPGVYRNNGIIYPPKTTYDPLIITEDANKAFGYEVFKQAIIKNDFDQSGKFEVLVNGVNVEGYFSDVINGLRYPKTWYLIL